MVRSWTIERDLGSAGPEARRGCLWSIGTSCLLRLPSRYGCGRWSHGRRSIGPSEEAAADGKDPILGGTFGRPKTQADGLFALFGLVRSVGCRGLLVWRLFYSSGAVHGPVDSTTGTIPDLSCSLLWPPFSSLFPVDTLRSNPARSFAPSTLASLSCLGLCIVDRPPFFEKLLKLTLVSPRSCSCPPRPFLFPFKLTGSARFARDRRFDHRLKTTFDGLPRDQTRCVGLVLSCSASLRSSRALVLCHRTCLRPTATGDFWTHGPASALLIRRDVMGASRGVAQGTCTL